MNQLSTFWGEHQTIYKIDFNKMKEVFYYIFGSYNVGVKIRLFGEEMSYSNNSIEFHGNTRYEEHLKSELFYIDISCFAGLEESINLVNKLETGFVKNDLIYEIEYVEEDEFGKLLGDEVVVKHPNYDLFMSENFKR